MEAAKVKTRELLPGTSEQPRLLVSMGNDIEKSSNRDQSKKCSTRKYAVGDWPQGVVTVRDVSTDNENGELARVCEGDATKSSISKSAPSLRIVRPLMQEVRCSSMVE